MIRWRWSDALSSPGRSLFPFWFKSLCAFAPWISAALLFAMVQRVAGSLSSARGTLLDLPGESARDVADVTAAALLMDSPRGAFVFFDDTRYMLDDESQFDSFSGQLRRRAGEYEEPVLLVLADAEVRHSDLMRISSAARKAGFKSALFAERSGR